MSQLVEQLLDALLELPAEFRSGDQCGDVEREEAFPGDRVGHLAPGDAQCEPLDDGAFSHARLADEHWVVLPAAREDLHDPLDLGLAPHHGVDPPFAGQAREVGSEPVNPACRALGMRHAARLGSGRRLEPRDADADLGAEVVAHGEALQLLGDDPRVDVVHFQRAGRCRRTIGDDFEQGVGRRDAPDGRSRGEQVLGEVAVEFLRRLRFPGSGYGDFALDAQPYLMQFPILQTGGEQLIGQRPLLEQQLQREKILVRMGQPLPRCLERRAGDDLFESL